MSTPADYKSKLTDEQYDVLFNKATEAPFSGEYDQTFAEGEYACAACGTVLFDSNKKFDAHCGWPSFYDAVPGKVEFHVDTSFGSTRTEVTCVTCGGHLGHVFEGEGFGTPTDKRYCINSLSLTFTPTSSLPKKV
ncbi:MAG: Peptide methionine sulfoxide reductase [Candidatus Saccharibacteria bacterium]|nr:Peptide methionine sulfoxide reductase [Candidatus Saccharibacteria bacterium]